MQSQTSFSQKNCHGRQNALAALEEAKGRETVEFVLKHIGKAIAAIEGRLADGEEDGGEMGEP